MREMAYQAVQFRNDRNIVPYYSFSGGIYDTENTDRLADNEVSDMINLDIQNDGSLVMRDNFILADILPTSIKTNTSYKDVAVFDKGTGYEIIGLLNGDIVKIPTEEVLFSGFGDHLDSVQYQGLMYLLGGGHLLVYNGTDMKDISEFYKTQLDSLTEDEKEYNDLEKVKKGTIISVAQGRILISGIAAEPFVMYISNPFEPYMFYGKDNDDKILPVHSDYESITALEEYADGVLIFKKESIYLLSGVIGGNSAQMYRMNAPTGTMSPNTIKRIDNFLVFLGTDLNVYGIYGGSYYSMTRDRNAIYLFSGTVSKLLKRISAIDRERVSAIFNNGVYMLAFPLRDTAGKEYTETLNMYVLDKNTNDIVASQAWGRYDHVDIKGFIEIPGQDFYMYSNNSTRIYRFSNADVADYGFDTGQTRVQYTVYIKFKQYNLEIPEHYKIFRAGWIQFSKAYKSDFAEFKHNVYIDNNKIYLPYLEDMQLDQFDNDPDKWSSSGANILWDDFYWAGKNNDAYYFRINAKGRTVQNELKFKTRGKKVSILGTTFEFKFKYPQRSKFNTGFKRGN